MTEPTSQAESTVDLPIRTVTLFGVGYSPMAPGTVACVPVLILILAFVRLIGGYEWTHVNRLMLEGSIALVALIGIAACMRFGNRAEQHFGRKDPSPVVMDEVAGQAVALLWLPWATAGEERALGWNLLLAFTAFITFRVFDIVKPPPARGFQRLWGGVGIVMDDIAAGAYAWLATQGIVRFLYM